MTHKMEKNGFPVGGNTSAANCSNADCRFARKVLTSASASARAFFSLLTRAKGVRRKKVREIPNFDVLRNLTLQTQRNEFFWYAKKDLQKILGV